MTECNWKYDEWEDRWHADCGLDWTLNDGTPRENGMNYCPGCGKPLVEVPKGERDDT